MKWLKTTLISAAITFPFTASIAKQETWPTTTVKLVVPYPAGSSNDLLARLLAPRLEKKYGQTFIVENKPGASGAIGISEVARAKPDGYTILVVSNSMVTNLAIPDQVKYDVFRDFEPISQAAVMPVVMVTNQELPVKNVSELVTLAKSEPGKLSFGSSGAGGPHHLTAELFQSVTGTEFLHVPYKGQSPILMDLLANRINAAFVTLGPALPYIQSGQLTSMGVIGKERSSIAADIPTLAEQGVEGLDLSWWLGVFVPKGTPASIVASLSESMAQFNDESDLQQQLNSNALNYVGDSPAEFSDELGREIAMWKKLAKEIGLTQGGDHVSGK
ncbi:Bug family tripartite tricarboxylate transporter substrate binding protein [Alcaligenes endophyticus]|uniref:Tripartite tricarboxylate transporter substrate binding protein n=1 Tax=Alcaligenes endophyticus TaxID=1929088 RepID=A0ABT8EGD6_9BURK|nr:tripartite tricarboxylate transporter substrate binding protein [Alcaligenes endophyticus]MCX5590004.1 tripartite tricarboxylate transporter substrate binding protein [Alcaligenes endophyticus]MDN4120333.1 tripartite tricarboxylate transporter substrate binding protein [Alcaligenes endophyticus]